MRLGTVDQLMRYLMELAPSFFGDRIKRASEDDLKRLQAASRRPLPRYHRDFLLAAGATPPGKLDPFLKGRPFDVNSLVRAYEALQECRTPLPTNISVFTASEYLDDSLFLRQVSDDPTKLEIGILDLDSGRFLPEEIGSVEDYLTRFAFTFRLAQCEHVLEFSPRERMVSAPGLKVLSSMGLTTVFKLPSDTTCLEGGPSAAVIYGDGSGYIGSDDRKALIEICEVLADNAAMTIQPRPDRLVAPKREPFQ